ncbi:MAG: hypothetical protein KIT43_14625 [Bauldia sp.]|nr:hypothetical protein [Bauldia sp.]
MTELEMTLLHQLSALAEAMGREVDLVYDDEELAAWAANDEDGRTFLESVAIVRQHGGDVGEVVQHLEGRLDGRQGLALIPANDIGEPDDDVPYDLLSRFGDTFRRILGLVTEHYALELWKETDVDLAAATDAEDSRIVTFRRAVQFLGFAPAELSEPIVALERRIERAYREEQGSELPPLGDDDGAPFVRMLWDAQRRDRH